MPRRAATSLPKPRRPRFIPARWVLSAALILLGGGALQAQESLRASLASEDAAKARRDALKGQKYNIELGDLRLRLIPTLEMEANDNVTASSSDPQADIIFRPQLGISSVWRVSEFNSLNLALGVGYMKYLRDTEPENFFVTPGSDLALDLITGDVTINLHSRFSYSQDVSADPTVSGIGSVPRFINTTGTRVQWDLNDLVLSASYDHMFYQAMSSDFTYLTQESDLASVSAALRVSPTIFLGFQIGGGMTDFEEDIFHDSAHVAAGPLLEWHVSDYTNVRLAAGYTSYFDTSDATNKSSSGISGFYFDFRLKNRLNAMLTHSLFAGQQVQSGIGSSTFEIFYVRHEATWRLFERTGVTTSISYESVPPSGNVPGSTSAALDRYGFGLKLQRGITEHLNGSLGYQWYYKVSDVATSDYVQNRLVLTLGYTF